MQNKESLAPLLYLGNWLFSLRLRKGIF